jgi:hypothetical protein
MPIENNKENSSSEKRKAPDFEVYNENGEAIKLFRF